MTLVVIMAGGRGTRLHPLTERTPKPMLRVGSKPILETILGRFIAQGFKQFVFSVNYRAEVIERYFGDGSRWGVSVAYVREDRPLGTAGSLARLLPRPGEPFIVANGDVLADVDYRAMLRAHEKAGAVATVALGLHQYQIPFGVPRVNDVGEVVRLDEKPIENTAVAAGIYVLSPAVLAGLGLDGGRLDMPELLGQLIEWGQEDGVPAVVTYPIEGHWIDVGRFEDLGRANGVVG